MREEFGKAFFGPSYPFVVCFFSLLFRYESVALSALPAPHWSRLWRDTHLLRRVQSRQRHYYTYLLATRVQKEKKNDTSNPLPTCPPLSFSLFRSQPLPLPSLLSPPPVRALPIIIPHILLLLPDPKFKRRARRPRPGRMFLLPFH